MISGNIRPVMFGIINPVDSLLENALQISDHGLTIYYLNKNMNRGHGIIAEYYSYFGFNLKI